jgi:hypothetical protein
MEGAPCPDRTWWQNVELLAAPGNRMYALFFVAILALLLWAFLRGLWTGRMWGLASWSSRTKPIRYWFGQLGCGAVLLLWALLMAFITMLPSCL